MTLVRYMIKSISQWQVIECRSASIPLSFSSIIQYIKVFEHFTFLLNDMAEQDKIFCQLEMESQGLVQVPQDETVAHFFIMYKITPGDNDSKLSICGKNPNMEINMTQQETSPNLLSVPKPLPIDLIKGVTAIGITYRRYYEPTEEEKRNSTSISLKVSVDQQNEKGNLEIKNSQVLGGNEAVQLKDQAHNWENDPLGLCLSQQNNGKVLKKTENDSKSKSKDVKENSESIIMNQTSEKATDSITMEDIISPTAGTMSRYMTATSEDFDLIDGLSPAHSPQLRFSLDRSESCNDLMWKVQEPLSRWLYNNNTGKKEVAAIENAWDAIFHPMSTFQHVKGELKYYNWNPDDVPVTGDLVIQRVFQARHCSVDSRPSFAESIQTEATIPQLAPTPLFKQSPVLALESEDIEIKSLMTQEIAVNPDKQKYYFHMLQNIRAPSHSTVISFQAATKKSKASLSKKEEKNSTLPSIFGIKHSNTDESDIEKSIDVVIAEKHYYWNERRLFWFGFLCPLLWFHGSVSKYRNSVNKRWQKRCRLAALYFSIVASIVVLVVVVKLAGNAAIRQSQSDKIRAVIAN